MITDQELKLDRKARELDVRILPDLHGELHPDDLGGWFAHSRRILYRPDLTYVNAICAVAHELGHAYYDDHPTDDPLRDERQELRADRYAADLLITHEAYEEAEHLVGCHEGAIAHELNVTVELVTIWRDAHERTMTP